MKDIKNNILKKIENKNLLPKPKWHFLAKEYFVWIMGVLFVFVEGMVFSLIIFRFSNSDFDTLFSFTNNFFEFAIKYAPYLWIFFFIFFLVVSVYNFLHTKRGYRFNIVKIASFVFLISIVFGFFFYKIGLADMADHQLGRNLSFYQEMREQRKELWNNPEAGFLSGRIISYDKKKNLILRDFNGEEWDILLSHLDDKSLFVLSSSKEIKLVGVLEGRHFFKACVIRPWNIRGRSFYLKNKNELGHFKTVLSSDKSFFEFKKKKNYESFFPNIRNNLCEEDFASSTTGLNY